MAKENIDNQGVKSKKDSFRESFAKRYPDVNMDDEDAVYGQLSTDYDTFDQNNQRMNGFNEMLQEYPQAPGLITGMMTKKNEDGSDFDFMGYLIDAMGKDFVDAVNGDAEARKRLSKKEKDELEASKKLAESEKQLAANMEQEDKELDAFMKEQKVKPEQMQAMIDWLYHRSEDGEEHDDDGFVYRAARYELKKEDFKRLWQIKDFDTAVSDAEERGYKRGKNEKIDQQKHMHDGNRGGKKNINLNGGGGPAAVPKGDDTVSAYRRMQKMGI